MHITIQTLEGMEYTIEGVEPEQTVDKLKHKIKTSTHIEPQDQTLIYLGQTLEDGILQDYNVVDGCKINLNVKSIGGK